MRDVVQFSGTNTVAVDHLVYSAFGQLLSQTAARPVTSRRSTTTALGKTRRQALTRWTARWYDAVDAVFANYGTSGPIAGAVNPYEFEGDDPTVTNVNMACVPTVSDSPVGLENPGTGQSDFTVCAMAAAEYVSGGGTPVQDDNPDNGSNNGFGMLGEGFYLRPSGNSDTARTSFSLG